MLTNMSAEPMEDAFFHRPIGEFKVRFRSRFGRDLDVDLDLDLEP
jgi:hypothetical protein